MFGLIIEKKMNFKCSMFLCSFKDIKGEGNKLVHALARRAISGAVTNMWLEDLPLDLDGVFQYNLDCIYIYLFIDQNPYKLLCILKL